MKENVTRIIIETMVRKTLNDALETPERSSRNLIELGLNLTNGSFQTHFMQMAQKMLEDENSEYYNFISNFIRNVNHESILKFGLNVGYNSCIVGANLIRKREAKEHFSIPWAITLHIDAALFEQHNAAYQSIINQGIKLGIYVYFLRIHGEVNECLPWIKKNDSCAFFLVCDPTDITDCLIEGSKEINNIMYCVKDNGMLEAVCGTLKKNQMLYAMYKTYDNKEADQLKEYLADCQQWAPYFIILSGSSDCSEKVKVRCYEEITAMRTSQEFPYVLLDEIYDQIAINDIISQKKDLFEVMENGQLVMNHEESKDKDYNIFEHKLEDILRIMTNSNAE